MYENSNSTNEVEPSIINPVLNQQELVEDLKNSLSKTIKDVTFGAFHANNTLTTPTNH